MDARGSSDRPVVDRRTVLAGVCSVFVAGCAIPISGGSPDTTTGAVVQAIAVDDRPDGAETTPREDIENPHIRETVERVCDDGESDVQVRVTGEDVTAVKNRLAELPDYSPSDGSDAPHGSYVECDGKSVAVRLLIED